MFVGIKEGILLGVFAALLYMLFQSTQPHIAVLGQLKNTHYFKNINRFTQDIITFPGVLILRFDGQLFFGNQAYFKSEISQLISLQEIKVKHLVLAAAPISYIDATAFQMLIHWTEELNKKHITVYWTGLNGPLRDRFHQWEILQKNNQVFVYSSLESALNAIQGIPPTDVEKSIASQRNNL